MIDVHSISTNCTRTEFVGTAVLDTIGLVISGVHEDLLKEMALDIPFSLKISKGLNKLGIKVSNQIKQEELVRELCQLHSTK